MSAQFMNTFFSIKKSRPTTYAASLLALIMTGATITRLLDEPELITIAVHLVQLTAYIFLAYVRRPESLRTEIPE